VSAPSRRRLPTAISASRAASRLYARGKYILRPIFTRHIINATQQTVRIEQRRPGRAESLESQTACTKQLFDIPPDNDTCATLSDAAICQRASAAAMAVHAARVHDRPAAKHGRRPCSKPLPAVDGNRKLTILQLLSSATMSYLTSPLRRHHPYYWLLHDTDVEYIIRYCDWTDVLFNVCWRWRHLCLDTMPMSFRQLRWYVPIPATPIIHRRASRPCPQIMLPFDTVQTRYHFHRFVWNYYMKKYVRQYHK